MQGLLLDNAVTAACCCGASKLHIVVCLQQSALQRAEQQKLLTGPIGDLASCTLKTHPIRQPWSRMQSCGTATAANDMHQQATLHVIPLLHPAGRPPCYHWEHYGRCAFGTMCVYNHTGALTSACASHLASEWLTTVFDVGEAAVSGGLQLSRPMCANAGSSSHSVTHELAPVLDVLHTRIPTALAGQVHASVSGALMWHDVVCRAALCCAVLQRRCVLP